MKLRNKKTGDVFDFDSITDLCFGSKIQLQATNMHNKPIYIFNSLAELNEEWEDYQDPKHWFISEFGRVYCVEDVRMDRKRIGWLKEIGNWFDNKEDAEKVVEKFKLFKRLKNQGFSFFNNKIIGEYGNVSYRLNYPATTIEEKDLELIFGGKE